MQITHGRNMCYFIKMATVNKKAKNNKVRANNTN